MTALRYCTTCQKEQPAIGGHKDPRLCRGWRCAQCCTNARLALIRAAAYRLKQKEARA